MRSLPRRRRASSLAIRSWWRRRPSATRCCGRSCRSSPVSRSAPLPPNSTAAASRAGAASLGTRSLSGMRWYASAFGQQGARHDASPRGQRAASSGAPHPHRCRRTSSPSGAPCRRSRVTRNVKHWRDAGMALRWVAAGMIDSACGPSSSPRSHDNQARIHSGNVDPT